MLREHTILNSHNTIRDSKQLAWFISLTSSDSKASRWLDVTPKAHEFKFKSDEFQALLLCYHSLSSFLNLNAIVNEILN